MDFALHLEPPFFCRVALRSCAPGCYLRTPVLEPCTWQPSEAADIQVKGSNEWLTLIQNAQAKNTDSATN